MYVCTHIYLEKCNNSFEGSSVCQWCSSFICCCRIASLPRPLSLFFFGGVGSPVVGLFHLFAEPFNFETRMILVLRIEIYLYAKVVNQELLLDVARISKPGNDAFNPEGDLEIRSMATLTLSL